MTEPTEVVDAHELAHRLHDALHPLLHDDAAYDLRLITTQLLLDALEAWLWVDGDDNPDDSEHPERRTPVH